MTLTITFAGVLLFLLSVFAVVAAAMLCELFAKIKWLENQNDYAKERDDRQHSRIDGVSERVRTAEKSLDRINGAFLPVVTAWAANQNRTVETPKSEG